MAVLSLAIFTGCAAPALRKPDEKPLAPTPQQDHPAPELDSVPEQFPSAPSSQPQPQPVPLAQPWGRLREGMRFADCARNESALTAVRGQLLRNPKALRQEMAQIAARLDWVLETLLAAQLPAEFALLPWVESGYRAVPGNGRGPAGPWQFMPRTARDLGLRVDQQRDERLDLGRSTAAAIALLQHLGKVFDGDWNLATMAFNAGEFRIRRARAAQPGALPTELRVAAVTHRHLSQLRAISCILADPSSAGIELPTLAAQDRLQAVSATVDVPLPVVADWTGIDVQSLRAVYSARRDGRLTAGASLLLPAAAVVHFQAGQTRWIAERQSLGHEHIVRPGESLWSIARRYHTTIRALVEKNAIDPKRPLRSGQILVLPN